MRKVFAVTTASDERRLLSLRGVSVVVGGVSRVVEVSSLPDQVVSVVARCVVAIEDWPGSVEVFGVVYSWGGPRPRA